ncbi:hypothetical protein HN873_054739, partial [Arachis hypogaea]
LELCHLLFTGPRNLKLSPSLVRSLSRSLVSHSRSSSVVTISHSITLRCLPCARCRWWQKQQVLELVVVSLCDRRESIETTLKN